VKIHSPVVSLLEGATQAGLKKAGREVLKVARKKSPTDEGGSDKSGFSLVDDLTLQVGFRSPISRMQHENLDFQHKDGEQAKFLEAAVDEVDIGAILAAEVRATFG
jgi:hypothetical protein